MSKRLPGCIAAAAIALFATAGATGAHAASVYLVPVPPLAFNPGTTTVPAPAPSQVAFQLMMNFSTSELTVGGGIDIDVTGAASFVNFVPSSYFNTTPDPAFTGHGTLRADQDYEVHLGSFTGLSGLNNLGTLTVAFAGPTATVTLAPNSFFGGFYSATTALPLDVQMSGASIGAVPEPQAALLLLAGLGLVGVVGRRRVPAR